MWRTRSVITAMAAAALAVACGGGGDDAVVPQGPTFVKITAANQDAVARASIASIMPFVSVPVMLSSPSPALAKAAQAAATSALGRHGGLAPLIRRALDVSSGQTTAAPAGMARPLAQYTDIYPCMVSGTMTVTLDDKDNTATPTAGDTVSISFSQCDDGLGQTANGGMVLAIATYSQTPTVEDVTGSIAFQSLVLSDPPESFSLNGSATFRFTFTLQTEGSELFVSFAVASGGLTVAWQGSTPALSDTFSYRAGFTASDRDFTANPGSVSPSSEVLTANGDFGSRALGGDLRLTTVTPFKSVFTDPEGDIFPSEGKLLVTGGEGTKLQLTAATPPQVIIQVSYDSDDDWEYEGMTDWPSLLP